MFSKYLLSILGTVLKAFKIPTNIKSRDFDAKRTLKGVFLAMILALFGYSVERLYKVSSKLDTLDVKYHALIKTNAKTQKRVMRLRLRLERCKQKNNPHRSKPESTISKVT